AGAVRCVHQSDQCALHQRFRSLQSRHTLSERAEAGADLVVVNACIREDASRRQDAQRADAVDLPAEHRRGDVARRRPAARRGATLSCETFDAVDPMFPCGKNWMKMSAVDDAATDPIGELLKMLRSVMKFVPFKPRTEPTTGMKISFVTASGPAMAPF